MPSCNVKGCECQTEHRNERAQELRRIPYNPRNPDAGAAIVCVRCHARLFRDGSVSVLWSDSEIYKG